MSRMNQRAPCMFCMLMCLVIEAPLAMDIHISNVYAGAPYKDVEFYNKHLAFLNSRNHRAYIPIAVACIFIGIVGNACFLFFFGQPASAVYLTRDALYLRRLAGADMIICVCVIPYSMLFEATLIENTIMCKTMEYIRHVLTFTSHLILISYSMEFNEEDDYYLANMRLNRSMLIIVFFAGFVSSPVLVIFEVGAGHNFSHLDMNVSKVSTIMRFTETPMARGNTAASADSDRFGHLKPNFCHMSLNYDGAGQYYTVIKTLQVLHFMTFGFVLFLSIILVVSKSMQFMEHNPLMGRQSMFINVIEVDHPDLTNKLERMSIHERRSSRQSRKSRKYSSFEAVKLQGKPSQEISDSKKLTNGNADVLGAAGNSTVPYKVTLVSKHNSEASTSVDNNAQNPVSGEAVRREPSQILDPATETSDPLKSILVNASKGQDGTEHKRLSQDNSRKSRHSIDKYDLVMRAGGARRDSHKKHSITSDTDVSLVKFLCGCECVRSRGKHIQTVRESYKLALACIIVLDILVAAATILSYLITEQTSVALNLIHFRSVFSFYIISFFHEDLRRATWGCAIRGRCCL